MDYGSFVAERILRPLKMNHTTARMDIPPENYAESYFAGLTGEQAPIGCPRIVSGAMMGGSNAIKSCVSDLLRYYNAMIQGWRNETGVEGFDNSQTPLRSMLQMVTPLTMDPSFRSPTAQYGVITE